MHKLWLFSKHLLKHHSRKFYFFYCFMLIAIILISISFVQKRTSIGIASYDTYVNPKPRLTKSFNPKYKYRFKPKKDNYLDHKIIHVSVLEKRITPNASNKGTSKAKITTVKHHASIKAEHYYKPQTTMQHHKYRAILHKFLYRTHFIRHYRHRRAHAATIFKRVIKKEKIYINPKYTFHNTPHSNIVYVRNNYPIWSQPYKLNTKYISSTNELHAHNQAVKIIAIAHSNKHQFYHIISGGYDYGWIERDAFSHKKIYQLPFHYYSQLQPYYAPDACEAVALRMALSVKGKNPRISMKKFIKRIPRSKDPNKGYTHNPLELGDHAAIFPKALAKYAHKYDIHAYPYTGISKSKLINNLKQGNPIIYEGSYQMRDIDSDHTLILIGYCQGQLEFADPYYKKGWPKPISWVSIHKFTKLFHQPLRGARAVVVE